MDVEAVGEGQRRVRPHVLREIVGIELGLQLVGGQHHHDVGPFGAIGGRHHFELRVRCLLGRGGAGTQADADVLYAAVAQIVGVGMALAAIAEHQYLLALDQIHVGIAIVINAHGFRPLQNFSAPREIATMPVRETSTSPSGSIRLIKESSFSVEPVISNTKLSMVESTTRARKISARRRLSIRLSPLAATLISASSRDTCGPSAVRSRTV